ncbi:hypothetical protein K493DRAFT_334278, partial [Basidiobolus meristosporus CBS 931.73]
MASHTPKSSNGSHYSPRVAPPQPKPLPGISLSTRNLVPLQPQPRPHPLFHAVQSSEDSVALSNPQQVVEAGSTSTSSPSNLSKTPVQQAPLGAQNETPERTPIRLIRQVANNLNLINGEMKSRMPDKIVIASPQTPGTENDSSWNTSQNSYINSSSLSTDVSPLKIFDPGRRQDDAKSKVPTTLLNEDLLYEGLDKQLASLTTQPSSLASIFFTCDQKDVKLPVNNLFQGNVVVPNVHFRLRYIKPLKVAEGDVLNSLKLNRCQDGNIGYIVLDNSGSLNVVSEETVRRKQNRIVGLWAYNVEVSNSGLVDKIIQYIAW